MNNTNLPFLLLSELNVIDLTPLLTEHHEKINTYLFLLLGRRGFVGSYHVPETQQFFFIAAARHSSGHHFSSAATASVGRLATTVSGGRVLPLAEE